MELESDRENLAEAPTPCNLPGYLENLPRRSTAAGHLLANLILRRSSASAFLPLFWCGVRCPCRPAWLPVAHSVPPPPRGRPAPDLHALFGTRPQPTHSAHSLTSPDPYARSAGAGVERARILCPACFPACMMCPCKHTRVVCPADHPQPANDDEQTQPVGAIVGSDEQQRARSCRAGAHAVPSQPTVHPQAARSLVPTNTYARSHRASPGRASPRRTSRPPSRTRASRIK